MASHHDTERCVRSLIEEMGRMASDLSKEGARIRLFRMASEVQQVLFEDRLSHTSSGDLTQSKSNTPLDRQNKLSLLDYYHYSQELCGGNHSLLDSCVSEAKKMSSKAEIEAFFREQFGDKYDTPACCELIGKLTE